MAFSNEVLRSALAKVEQNRKNAELLYQKQKNAVYSANPELVKIDDDIKAKGSELALCTISGKTEKSKILFDEITAMKKCKDEILKNAGLSEAPSYTCKLCQDTGYTNGALCRCVKDIAADSCYSSLIGEMPLERSTFDNFNLDYYDSAKNSQGVSPKKQMTAVFKTCKKFADDFPKSANLILTGGCGLGKTHLSLAIANEIIAKDYHVIYGSAQNLINEVSRETFDRSGSTVKIDSLTSCDLLILDDLGTEFTTQLSVSVVYNIINTRLLRGLSTIISTNLSIDEISDFYNDRIASRIVGSYTICPVFGNDIRQITSVNR